MKKDFSLLNVWKDEMNQLVRSLLNLAQLEDLASTGDLTSLSMIPASANGGTTVRSRESGIICGLCAAEEIVRLVQNGLVWKSFLKDGDPVSPGTVVAEFSGPVQKMLGTERILLNFIGHMSGVATRTDQYVQAIKGTQARIYDTRKTLPGWRLLDKYAVACGGGHNHRQGLFDHILIKDNHIACSGQIGLTPADAVLKARQYLKDTGRYDSDNRPLIEIEVDTLDQLKIVLTADPDIVLLDNMGPSLLREAVKIRSALNPRTELEASGGINITTVRAAAETGVERISIGALTHSAPCFDVGLDWQF